MNKADNQENCESSGPPFFRRIRSLIRNPLARCKRFNGPERFSILVKTVDKGCAERTWLTYAALCSAVNCLLGSAPGTWHGWSSCRLNVFCEYSSRLLKVFTLGQGKNFIAIEGFLNASTESKALDVKSNRCDFSVVLCSPLG